MVIVSFTIDVSFLYDWIYWFGRLNEKYSYAALKPLDEHRLTLELPGKTSATWSADDEEFFEDLADEGFFQAWTRRFYRLVEADGAHEPGGTRSMAMVFLTLEMPYEKFPAFTERLPAMYPYSALQWHGSHDYALELPGKSNETWNAHDERYFSDFLVKEGFLQAGAWYKRFYLLIEDEDRLSSV